MRTAGRVTDVPRRLRAGRASLRSATASCPAVFVADRESTFPGPSGGSRASASLPSRGCHQRRYRSAGAVPEPASVLPEGCHGLLSSVHQRGPTYSLRYEGELKWLRPPVRASLGPWRDEWPGVSFVAGSFPAQEPGEQPAPCRTSRLLPNTRLSDSSYRFSF